MILPDHPRGPWTHRVVDVDGPVHVLDLGGPADGPPIVLVHGLDGSAANWVDLGPLLVASGHRVVAVDLPGFGRSPHAGRRLTLAATARVVAESVRGLGLGPALLVGNSWGGPVALWAAAGHADVCDGVVLVAPALPRRAAAPFDPAFAAAFCLPYLVPGLMRTEPARRHAQPAALRVRSLLDLCYAPGARESDLALTEMVDVAAHRTREDHVVSWYRASRSLFWWMARPRAFHRVAARVEVPVTLVEGERDPIIPARSVRAALARHPRWAHRTVDAGHVPPLEAPLATRDVVASAHRRSLSAQGIA